MVLVVAVVMSATVVEVVMSVEEGWQKRVNRVGACM
jgi:hypothetical protein